MEYFHFTDMAEARKFFVYCLEKGILVEFECNHQGYGVIVHVKKTLDLKNAKTND